jgi:MFS family permease
MMQLVTLLITSSMTVMAGAIISPALPQIQSYLQLSGNAADALWVKQLLTVPALFTAIGAAPAGFILDRWGRKWPLAIAVLVYGLAGSSGLWLNHLNALLVGRALLGLSVALITTASVALVADYYQGATRNRVMGWQAACMGLGGVVSLLLGGALATRSGQLPFAIYLVGVAVLPLVLRLPPVPPAQPMLRAQDEPLPMTKPLPRGTIALIYGLTVVTMLIFYLIPVQLAFYLKTLGFGSSWEAGIGIATTTLASAVASLSYARLKTRLSFGKVLLCLYLLMASGYGVMATAPNYAVILIGLLIVGLGVGLALPNMNVWINAKTPVGQRGRAIGGLTACLFLGQFLSPWAVQPLVERLSLRAAYGVPAQVLLGMALVIGWGCLTRQRWFD